VRRYCERTGRAEPDAVMADWNFYLAYNLFRLAAILQGIAKRVVDGTAASAQARVRPAPAPGRWPNWLAFAAGLTPQTPRGDPDGLRLLTPHPGAAGRVARLHGRTRLPERSRYWAEIEANTQAGRAGRRCR
jgi:hypothetical protein